MPHVARRAVAGGMDIDARAQLLRLGPEGMQIRIADLAPACKGRNADARQTELAHGPFEFGDCMAG